MSTVYTLVVGFLFRVFFFHSLSWCLFHHIYIPIFFLFLIIGKQNWKDCCLSHTPDPIVLMSLTVNTSGPLYDDFCVCTSSTFIVRLVLWVENYSNNIKSIVLRVMEDSDQFRFLHSVSFPHLNGSVGLFLFCHGDYGHGYQPIIYGM